MIRRIGKKKGFIWGIAISIILLSIVFILLWFDLDVERKIKKGVNHPNPTYLPAYHFSTLNKWKNDPQKPIYFDGKYHYYYLYNNDYPKGNGTEWRHATSKDLVHWKDEGIAIPKYTNPNGDVWSGSVVEDKENTAGFGKGSIIAVMTQPSADGQKQEQYLWYSTDRGKTFTSYSNEPIMPNPGTKDFRDPKIIWDDQDNKWVMVLAEGTKIGFYESHNLKDWEYTGAFMLKDIGISECPDLFRIQANDGTYKWVLGASANGKPIGQPNTYAYWIGNYNGKQFFTENSNPKWLDHGFDWYGGVTFEGKQKGDKLNKRYAFAWMNNWDYPNNTPTIKAGFNGFDSIVREIKLQKQNNGQYTLNSQPIERLNELTNSKESFQNIKVNGRRTLKVEGDAYQLDTDISWSNIENVGLRLRESKNKKRHIDVGIFTKEGFSYVNRSFTNQPDISKRYVESKALFDKNKKKVHLKILVDKTSIEVFVDDGEIVYSNQAFPPLKDKGITLFSEGGVSTFDKIEIKYFRSIKR